MSGRGDDLRNHIANATLHSLQVSSEINRKRIDQTPLTGVNETKSICIGCPRDCTLGESTTAPVLPRAETHLAAPRSPGGSTTPRPSAQPRPGQTDHLTRTECTDNPDITYNCAINNSESLQAASAATTRAIKMYNLLFEGKRIHACCRLQFGRPDSPDKERSPSPTQTRARGSENK